MAKICAVTNDNIQASDLMAICTRYPDLKNLKASDRVKVEGRKVD